MILGGELGEINAFRSNYIQGWLRNRLEQDNQKQAAWRTDPSKSGVAGLLRRHWYTCLQFGPLHDRPAARHHQRQSQDLRRRA